MAYLNISSSSQTQNTTSSRFNVFRLKSDVTAPPLPPKDTNLSPFYNRSLFSRSATSLSPESVSGPFDFLRRSGPRTSPAPSAYAGSICRAQGDFLPSSSMDGTDSSGSCQANIDMYLLHGANASSYTTATTGAKPKKKPFGLASLTKRNKSKKDLSDTASASGSVTRSVSVNEHEVASEGDEGISMPWNFQHNIHVDEGYIGLPPSWTSALSQIGFDEDEIAAIHARRRAAVTGSAPNTPNTLSPNAFTTRLNQLSATTPPVLLDPVPRSTSLGRGRDVLTSHPSSIYSNTSADGCVPSPRAPSFSMKSFVGTIKSSLAGDSASTKEGVGGSGRSEESEQYVFIDGNGPDPSIEPRSFDTASVASYHTQSSRTQGQSTPRMAAFPQIQVQVQQTHSDSGHTSPHPSTSHAPSPLAHSASLPTSIPPRGYTYSSPSPFQPLASAGSRPGTTSAPRTPPRRVYHIANPSDSYDVTNFTEPPPAYVSPKRDVCIPKREKDGLAILAPPPPPNRPIPPIPMEGSVADSSGLGNHDSRLEDHNVTMSDTGLFSANDIPATADEVLDISSYYCDNSVNGEGAEMGPVQQANVLSPTPPLVIDKRLSKLATLPPRVSLHQEGSLEDWSSSLFNVIGKRSSILVNSTSEKRSTIRPMPRPSIIDENAPETPSKSPDRVAPSLPDISLGADLTLGAYATDAIEEDGEQEETEDVVLENDAKEQDVDANTATAAEGEMKEVDASPSFLLLPDVSLSPHVSPLGKDLDPPASTPPSPPRSLHRVSIDSIPPSPPPKPKHKPAPIIVAPAITLAPPRTNIITGISGKSPVNSLFSVKPQPLPIPIPPSQIRAQLRPLPPKSPHPPPTLPLPPLKRLPYQPNVPPPLTLSPVPSPRRALQHDFPLRASLSPSSSQTLLPIRTNPDRDSDLSTITVTQATIATATTEVVRTAVASVIDSDAVPPTSGQESVVSTVVTECPTLASDQPDAGAESPRAQGSEEIHDDTMTSETSVSLLRDGAQSKWPTPPPPPVELEADSTPPRMSRFRTTSLGRVTQLQVMNSTVTSPTNSHFSHGSSSGWTNESTPLMTPNGVNGVSPSVMPNGKGGLPAEARLLSSTTDTFGGVESDEESESSDSSENFPSELVSIPPSTHPLLAQLHPYISPRDPLSCFTNLVEIAEGESGSVFAARVAPSLASAWLREGQHASMERPAPSGTPHVAIKRIPLPPMAFSPSLTDDSPLSNKLVSVLHEVTVLKNLDNDYLLLLDALYVDSNSADSESASAVDTSLWLRMELMERSLADVIGLVAEGLALQDRLIARFASDVLHGLDYLQKQHIAHRDVRSDNLLVNSAGVVKLTDFSNAIRVNRNAPTVSGAVGVIYWQAPEMRAGPYNALKVDTWSLGATVWELAETVPPFSTPASPTTQMSFAIQTASHVGSQWPALSHPEHYSRQFHEFLRLCGRESAGRPSPGELLNTCFIRNACGRPVILQLLSQCRAIEEAMVARESSSS